MEKEVIKQSETAATKQVNFLVRIVLITLGAVIISGGFFGFCYTANNIISTYSIIGSKDFHDGIITKTIKRQRAIETSIWMQDVETNQAIHFNLILVPQLKAGDKVRFLTDSERKIVILKGSEGNFIFQIWLYLVLFLGVIVFGGFFIFLGRKIKSNPPSGPANP